MWRLLIATVISATLLNSCGLPPVSSERERKTSPSGAIASDTSPSSTSVAASPLPSPTLTSSTNMPTVELPSPTIEQPSPTTIRSEPTAKLSTDAVETDQALLDEQSAAPTAAPTVPVQDVDAQIPVRITIDAIGLEQPLVSVGLDQNRIPIVPKHDIGWYNLSAQPGQQENVVFWGHVLRFRNAPDIPAPFAHLREAPIGSNIVVETAGGIVYDYVITEQVWATPDQVEYILPQGYERLTLVSCIGDRVIVNNAVELTHRLITIAEPAG